MGTRRKYACTGWLPCDLFSDCSLGIDGFVAQAEQGSFEGQRCCWVAPLPLDLTPGDLSAGPPEAASIFFPAVPPAALNNPSLLPFLPPPTFFLPCCPKHPPSLAVGGAGGPQCLVPTLEGPLLCCQGARLRWVLEPWEAGQAAAPKTLGGEHWCLEKAWLAMCNFMASETSGQQSPGGPIPLLRHSPFSSSKGNS